MIQLLFEDLPRQPIIAMTAHALDEHRAESFAAGIDDHLSKPVSLGNFEQMLKTWCVSHEADEIEAQSNE